MKSVTNPFAMGLRASGMPGWLLVLATVLSVTIALVSYRYLGPAAEVPSQIQANAFVRLWLMIHAAAAATALLLGPPQFFQGLRARRPAFHRWSGRVYVAGCIVGGVSGLVLACGASTGSATIIGFGTLAVAWVVSTSLAWRRALQRRIGEHKIWMIRSFALTFAAVTLRIYLTILEVFEFPFVPGYQAISFLCWIPNLLLAEWYIRREKRMR
jgi:uncharacterized membrane protein